MVKHDFVISADEAGQRLDHVLRGRFPEVSRRLRLAWFSERRVSLDGSVVNKGSVATVDQVCTVDAASDLAMPIVPVAGELCELWTDEQVVIVDKPPGLASAALAGSDKASVAAQLLARYPEMRDVGYSTWDAGLIHRLDTDTSGVLVAARTRVAFEELSDALRAAELTKSYLAWTNAAPAQERGVIANWLHSDPKHRRRMTVARPHQAGAKACETSYEVVAREGGFVVIRAYAALATRHQVRVHLAALGCPLVGDALYGAPSQSGLDRHALHAERVRFGGGAACSAFDCRAPIPNDLAALTPRFAGHAS